MSGFTSRLAPPLRKPEWVKISIRTGSGFAMVREMVKDLKLHTVCQEARCPNIFECFSNRTATFMILGENCTRRCGFCAVVPAAQADAAVALLARRHPGTARIGWVTGDADRVTVPALGLSFA